MIGHGEHTIPLTCVACGANAETQRRGTSGAMQPLCEEHVREWDLMVIRAMFGVGPAEMFAGPKATHTPDPKGGAT